MTRRSMTGLVLTVAIAVLSFSAMVVAAASLVTEREGPTEEPGWPAPQPPFDETPITPVETAGAPVFW